MGPPTTEQRAVDDGPVQHACGGCGTTLTAKDRYCAVCGHPNPRSARHPRFGPMAERRDVFTTPRPPGRGEVACPRCEWPAAESSTFCSRCGMELAGAVLRARRDPTVGVWSTYGPGDLPPYQPLDSWAVGLRASLWLCSLLSLGALIMVVLRFAANEQGESLGDQRWWLADLSDIGMWTLLGVGSLAGLWLVAFVVRAARNLSALAATDARYQRSTALWCWVVPVVNLILPYAVVEDIWRASGPDGPPLTRTRRPERPPLAVHLFWPCLVLGALLLVLAGVAMPEAPGADLSAWRVVLVLGGIGSLVLVAGFVSAAVTVGDVADRQALRADAVGPPSWLHRNEREGAEADVAPAGAQAGAADLRVYRADPFGKY